MNKRFLSGLAALAMVFSGAGALPGGTFEWVDLVASADIIIDSGKCGEKLTWELDSEGTLTISGTGEMYNFGDYLGEPNPQPWLDNIENIKKVVIGNGVTTIGSDAFYECENIESVELPDSLTHIGTFAFSFCYGLKSVTIPDNVETIDFYAFARCTNLENVTISNSVKVIMDGAFFNCTNIKNVTIPKNVTMIGDIAFGYHYDDTKGDVINEGFTITGSKGSAAEKYAKDKGFEFIDINTTFETIAGGECGENCTWTLDSEGTFTVSGTGDMIDTADDPFSLPWNSYRNDIKKVVIEDGITSIGCEAFYGCTNLTNVVFSKTLIKIGGRCFYCCPNLKNVNIPRNVSEIGYRTFGYDEDAGVVKVEGFTITGYTNSDAELYARKNEIEFVSIGYLPAVILYAGNYGDEISWSLDTEGTLTLEGYGTMPNATLLSDLPWNDYLEDIKKVDIEYGVYNIGGAAFADCPNLESVSIPYGVNDIGYNAFTYCTKLTSVTLPESVMSIGYGAFYNCPNLLYINIPESVTEIGSGALDETAWMKARQEENPLVIVNDMLINGLAAKGSVTIPDSATEIIEGAFYESSDLESLTVTGDTENIGDFICFKCENLSSVTIEEGVKKVGEYAFCLCSNLKNVTIPASVEEIGNFAFGYIDKYNDYEPLEGFTITGYNDTAAEIYAAENGFEFISLGEIPEPQVIADGECGENCTWTLDNLGTLTISGTGDMEDYTFSKAPWYTYRDNIKNLVVEDGVTGIGKNAFQDCKKIKNFTIADSVKQIKEYAFCGCSGIKELNLPDSVETIGSRAFKDCTGLRIIYDWNGVKSIGNSAFESCTSLESIILPDKITSIGKNAFLNCPKTLFVYVPLNVTKIGEKAFGYAGDKKTEGFTVAGYSNTVSEKYAADNKFEFIQLTIYGDISGDNKTDVDDLVLMQKKVAGWNVDDQLKDPYPYDDREPADLNGDGNVDVDDLVLMQKIVAGWKVEEIINF